MLILFHPSHSHTVLVERKPSNKSVISIGGKERKEPVNWFREIGSFLFRGAVQHASLKLRSV